MPVCVLTYKKPQYIIKIHCERILDYLEPSNRDSNLYCFILFIYFFAFIVLKYR